MFGKLLATPIPYSDLKNHSQSTQQGDRDVMTYYNDMMILWQELDLFEVEDWECPNNSVRYKKKVERSPVFVFLAGLNKDLDEGRG